MPAKIYANVSFYVVAHADDWQLFMQPNVYKDLVAPHTKVVFIIITAGDAGLADSYWKAREEGCKSSIRFCLAPSGSLSESTGKSQFNYYKICYWSINNATCYFLRLPDGNLDGLGFAVNDHSSLSRLKEGSLSAISAIDQSAEYQSWQDLHGVLKTLMIFESDGMQNVQINYLNPDTILNPNDHPDHIATGQAVQEMVISSLHVQQALFVGYSVGNNNKNLSGTELFWKIGMFAAYEKAVYDGSSYSTLGEGVEIYHKWCLSSSDYISISP